MTASDWLTPVLTTLGGAAGGGGFATWLQRDKTAADANLSDATAAQKRAEAEATTVQTIQNALRTVEALSVAKDEQIAQIRGELQAQGAEHTERLLAQQQKHSEQMQTMQSELRALTEQLSAMASALAAHGQWDLYVLAHVRQSMPDFPDPPPLTAISNGENERSGK